jgi:signal transduction histidine kinase
MVPWNAEVIEEKSERKRLRFFLSLGTPFLATALQTYLWAYINPFIFFMFYPAVFLSGWLGGLLGGMISTILSVLLLLWFFIHPIHSFFGGQPSSYLAIVIFSLNGFIISFLFHRIEVGKAQYAANLRIYNMELERRVLQRTSELVEARNQIASFASAQVQTIEQERRRVSREVHDQIGQIFTAIKLIIQAIPRGVIPQDQQDALEQAIDLGVVTTRKITTELRPPLLDDLGLVAALDYFGQEAARVGNLVCEIHVKDEQQLDTDSALGLFRISQEAVNNILRHATASRFTVSGQTEGDHYIFGIEDDGRGFDRSATHIGAMGIISMQERAHLIGGKCSVVSAPGNGTRVEVILPLNSRQPS